MIKAFAAMQPGGKLEEYTYDQGALTQDEVEIDVETCGICHSDLSMLNNEWGMTQYPFVPGHEVVGVVSAVGQNVTSVRIGQRVGLGWHSGYCNSCHTCHSGDHNLCNSAVMTIVGRHGGYADKVRAQQTAVVPLPEGVNAKSAGPMFCGGITVFNPLVQYNIKPTSRVGVIGIGGLGHIALQFLRAWGCEVTAFTSSDSKQEEAQQMGAHHVLNSRNSKELEAAAGRFDMILSTVNVKLDWNAYIATLAPKGRLHFVGATLEPIDVDVFGLLTQQRCVSASPVGSPAVIKDMLDFAALHAIEPVVEYFPFTKVNQALDHLQAGEARYRIVLTMD